MIGVKIFSNGFTVHGHSGYAKRGNDIVCAGVSSLTQAAVLGLRHYGVDMDVAVAPGEITVQIHSHKDVVEPIFTAMIAGLEEIARQYPENVKLTKGACEHAQSKEN